MIHRSSAEKNAALLAQALCEVEQHGCLLCKKRGTVYLGIFFPHDPIRFGGVPGKGRALCYRLCKRCKRLPDRNDRVERDFARRFAPLWN